MMLLIKKQASLLLLLLAEWTVSQVVGDDTPPAPLIIGGNDTAEGDYPYYVQMMVDDFPYCGGSLIAPDLVLSAAHCYQDQGNSIYSAAVGAWDRANTIGAEIRTCAEVINHPGFDSSTYDNDFALCKLDSPVNIDESKVYLKLNDESSIPANDDTTTVIGMGVVDDGYAADILQTVDVPAINNQRCSDVYIMGEKIGYGISVSSPIYDNMMCTWDRTFQTDACQGDSGGPLVTVQKMDDGKVLHTQVGIVSWGYSCALFPGVYSRVSYHYEWIKETGCNDLGSDAAFCKLPQTDPKKSKKPKKGKKAKKSKAKSGKSGKSVSNAKSSKTYAPTVSAPPTLLKSKAK